MLKFGTQLSKNTWKWVFEDIHTLSVKCFVVNTFEMTKFANYSKNTLVTVSVVKVAVQL